LTHILSILPLFHDIINFFNNLKKEEIMPGLDKTGPEGKGSRR